MNFKGEVYTSVLLPYSFARVASFFFKFDFKCIETSLSNFDVLKLN